MKSNSFLSLFFVTLMVMVLLISGPAQAQVDVSYRKNLSVDDVKVVRNIHDHYVDEKWDALTSVVDLAKPLFNHLNRVYKVNGESPSLRQDILYIFEAGDRTHLRRTLMQFLILNLHDVMTVARDANEFGDRKTARLYVNKSMLLFKTTIEPRINNPGTVSGALREINISLQEFKKFLGESNQFNESYNDGETALMNLFPDLNLTIQRND